MMSVALLDMHDMHNALAGFKCAGYEARAGALAGFGITS